MQCHNLQSCVNRVSQTSRNPIFPVISAIFLAVQAHRYLQAVVAQLEAERGAAEHRAQSLQLESVQQRERESRLVEEANMLRRAVQVARPYWVPSLECMQSACGRTKPDFACTASVREFSKGGDSMVREMGGLGGRLGTNCTLESIIFDLCNFGLMFFHPIG